MEMRVVIEVIRKGEADSVKGVCVLEPVLGQEGVEVVL